jgi:NodT family efflux transporter outer membrane factor (OMF) lipoprotein
MIERPMYLGRRTWQRILALGSFAILPFTGCLVGPNYHRPFAVTPPSFKELAPPPDPTNGTWKQAQPSAEKLRAKWWELYNDAQLSSLEEKVASSNQSLKAAYQTYVQARSQIKVDRAALFPTAGVGSSGDRVRLSSHRPLVIPGSQNTHSDITLEGSASWEPDLWGRVRRTVEFASASAQATNADFANVQLVLQADLAIDYFQLRGLDAQQRILDSTVASYKDYLKLTQRRFDDGLSSGADLALAQTQFDQTDAQATDIGVARAQYEHAIATLIGEPASTFSLVGNSRPFVIPTVPAGLPSELLERRPDVAAAERQAAAANAEIGIAQAAFYPNLNLNANGGFESVNPGTLIQGPSALWTLGASAAETLFDAGRRRAVKQGTIATYEQNAANYRETVLQSFQDVEDGLSTVRILNLESGQQAKAVADSDRSLRLSTLQYKRGLTNYLQVITAQTIALLNQRTAVDITSRQATASVQLIKALGGGWDVGQIPHP